MGGVNGEGYGTVKERELLRQGINSAHRLSYILANGSIPKGCDVHHLCGNRICVRPSHLILMEVIDHRRESFFEKGRTRKHHIPSHLDSWLKQRLDNIEE